MLVIKVFVNSIPKVTHFTDKTYNYSTKVSQCGTISQYPTPELSTDNVAYDDKKLNIVILH